MIPLRQTVIAVFDIMAFQKIKRTECEKMESLQVKTLVSERKSRFIYTLFGFLLGIAPLAKGVMPFGCALLCAMPKKGRKEAFFGVALASLFDESVLLSLFCAGFIYFVLTAKEKNGGVYMYTRVLLSFAVSALKSVYIALSGISDMPDVFRLLAAVIAYPAFTYAFVGFFDKKKELYKKRYDASLLAFAFAFTVLLAPLEADGVSLAVIPAAAFTLCAARKGGFAYGGACGIACGLVSGGAVTGALGVMGMCYGLLVNEVEILALILSYMLAVSSYFYLSGIDGTLVFGVSLLLVYAGFVPFRKHIEIYKNASSSAEKRANDRRISRYAAAFSSLSSLFFTVSDTTRAEGVTELNRKIVRTVDSYCTRCDGCELDKCEISNFFTSEIRRSGVAAYSRIPSHISSCCPHSYSMARAVNNLPTLREQEGEKGLAQMAEEYSAFSSILVDAAKKQEDKTRADKPLADKIKRALSEIGIECDGVRVTGTRLREITVFGVKPEKIKQTSNEISRSVAGITRCAVSPPEFVLHDGYTLMKLHSVPAFRVEYSKVSEAKNGETVCGDTVSVFENDEKYFYCLVSDGMGSGHDAALTSRLSAIMMEKLLSVGAEKESAIKLLNKALVEKQEEIFATVDLLEIDRIQSTATIIKAGAAPTLLIRDGKSCIIESKTPPAGIMPKVIADKKSFRIEKGDMIVMLSDGILQTGSVCPFLPSEGLPPMPSARALASKILKDARQNSETADDMSVCVLRIH